jgi:glutaredoxin
MKVKILYFEGCPTYKRTERTLKKVLSELGTEAEFELVAVDTDEEAERHRFPGSPTIRVNATPEGLKGFPTADMIRAKLA